MVITLSEIIILRLALDTVVSRAFNHEGAGRGHNFVTSTIVRQLVSMHLDEQSVMKIGDVRSFRDWSHVLDIVDGYILLAEKADPGSALLQGSARSNSVLSYILYVLLALGYDIYEISNSNGEKKVKNPLQKTEIKMGKATVESNLVDQMLLSNNLSYDLSDIGIIVETNKRKFKIEFDPQKFRPSDVPVLLSDTSKIGKLGFTIKKNLVDIVNDQINYYLDPIHRNNLLID